MFIARKISSSALGTGNNMMQSTRMMVIGMVRCFQALLGVFWVGLEEPLPVARRTWLFAPDPLVAPPLDDVAVAATLYP
jgi:hypothetical protein